MARQSIFDMKVSKVYPLLLQKLERKGRTKEGTIGRAAAVAEPGTRVRIRPGIYRECVRHCRGSHRRPSDAKDPLAGQAGG